jgi:DNA-binding beta-propeller fold protein YncE
VPVDNPTDLNTNFNEHNDYNFWEFLVLDAEETAYSSYLTKQLASATVSTTSVTRTTTSATGTSTYVPLCAGAPNPIYPLLTVPGWRAAVITNGLTSPRGIAFDKAGNLLVVQSGKGVSALKLNPTTGCLVSSSWVVNNTALNHGIAFSPDGNTLFVR